MMLEANMTDETHRKDDAAATLPNPVEEGLRVVSGSTASSLVQKRYGVPKTC